MAKKDHQSRGKQEGGAFVTSDPRFSQVYSDPRFRAPKNKDLKIQLDDRFNKDELKLGHSSAKVDRYGRRIREEDDENKDVFDKLYETKEKEESEEEDDSIMARARGLVESGESSSESSSDEEVDEEVSEEVEEIVQQEEEVPEGEPTRRIAAVNLDWDHVTSKDLFATFSGFVPVGGKILNVSIYPSEYGKMKMQEEEVEGPPKEFFKRNEDVAEDDDEDDDDEEIDIKKAAKELYTEDEGVDYNSKALRKYQLQRLRYYYAIVTCDNVETARAIYDSCDGAEYESTANMFDLRYVPEGMEFDDSKPRDWCDKVPAGYKPINFATEALRSSKVKLSWDETPVQRVEVTTRAFSQKEIDDMDFKAYLASDSSEGEGEEDEEGKKEEYRNLLKKSAEGIFNADEDDVDMEVTFTPGLSGENKQKEKEEEAEEESTIDKYRNREKERKKRRKEKIKEMKKEERREGRREAKGSKREDRVQNVDNNEDDDDSHHFKMKDILKAEKLQSKKKKSKKQKRQEKEIGEIDEEIKIDEGDSRFDEIFKDHQFAIDPTNPEFKKTRVMKQLLKEGNKRVREEGKKKHRGSKRTRR
ncbi:DEKNAAC101541 [Brettanomyces naardenensis]|uniref:DEKNAAC101541 n=1 Tax=Brettanomyces naardenensis TaxID=13370 RepID=A0A448YII9_BRENA|nr:DEKNAAC101541 [Brettanomyces naardenensis]